MIKNVMIKNKKFTYVYLSIFITFLILIFFHLLTIFINNILLIVSISWIFNNTLRFVVYKKLLFKENISYKFLSKFFKYFLLILIFFITNYYYLKFCDSNFDYPLVFFQFLFILIGSPINYTIMDKKIFRS